MEYHSRTGCTIDGRSFLTVIAVLTFTIILINVCDRPTTTPQGIAPQVSQVRGAVVHIARDGGGQASGCLISPDGILFTAQHVTRSDPNMQYTVTLDDGKQYPVKYVLEDRENDVSFMKLDLKNREPNLPYAQLAKEDTMRVGDALIIAGSPLGKDNINTFSLGILSATNRHLDQRRGWEDYTRYQWHAMIQSTSPAFPGNSGGPVFNMRGEVIGVLVAGQAETLNFAVPVARFRESISAVRQWFMLCRLRPLMPDMRGPRGPQGEPGQPAPVSVDPNAGENK